MGCSSHVGHQGLEGPEPPVIGAPPDALVEQPGVCPRPDHRRCSQRVIGLVVLNLGVGPVFGRVTLADAFELERVRVLQFRTQEGPLAASRPVEATAALRG